MTVVLGPAKKHIVSQITKHWFKYRSSVMTLKHSTSGVDFFFI